MSAARSRRIRIVLIALPIIVVGALLTAIVFGTSVPPTPLPRRNLDRSGLPPLNLYRARDGAALAYRSYPGNPDRVAVLIHGSGTAGSVMNGIG